MTVRYCTDKELQRLGCRIVSVRDCVRNLAYVAADINGKAVATRGYFAFSGTWGPWVYTDNPPYRFRVKADSQLRASNITGE